MEVEREDDAQYRADAGKCCVTFSRFCREHIDKHEHDVGGSSYGKYAKQFVLTVLHGMRFGAKEARDQFPKVN